MAKKKTPAKKAPKWLTPAVIVAIITTIGVVIAAVIKIIPEIKTNDSSSTTVKAGMLAIQIHVENENREPLSGVLVSLQPRGPNPPTTKYTDDLGNAIIEYDSKYSGDLAEISALLDSYQPYNQTVTLKMDGPPIDIQLKPK